MNTYQTSINMFLYPVFSEMSLQFLVTMNKVFSKEGIELKFTPSDGFVWGMEWGVMRRRKDDQLKKGTMSVVERKQKAIVKYIERTKNAFAARKECRLFHPNRTSVVASTEMQICRMNQTVRLLHLVDT